MPLLKKSSKGHLSQQKNGFKVPYANQQHKIRDIIDTNLNEPETKKAYHAFVESLSQGKNEDSSSPKNINRQIENSREKTNKTHKKLKRKKNEQENASESESTLSFDTEGSFSQKELNTDEIKTAYVEFMNNSVTGERNKKKSAIIYSSPEFVDGLSQGKYEDSLSPKKINGRIDGSKENSHKKTNKAQKKVKRKKNEYESPTENEVTLSYDTEGSISQEELNKEEIKTAYVEFMNNSLNGGKKKKSAIIYSSSEELLDDIVETFKKVDEKEKVTRKKNKTGKKKSKDRQRPNKQIESNLSMSDDEFTGLTIEEKMEKIYEKRNVGLYVLCDKCNNARYLPHIVDPLELPDKWFCYMNPDMKYNKCSVPEQVTEDREFLIDNLYNAGSIVFAKMDGYPWWPAMVEDDVDTETYFWLEGNSMSPTSYHVTFFDSSEVTRAWIGPRNLRPFVKNLDKPEFRLPEKHRYKSRMNVAVKQALEAVDMPLIDRLKTYGFLKRYKKRINRNRNSKAKENRNKRRRELSPLVDDDLSRILDNVSMSDLSFNFLD